MTTITHPFVSTNLVHGTHRSLMHYLTTTFPDVRFYIHSSAHVLIHPDVFFKSGTAISVAAEAHLSINQRCLIHNDISLESQSKLTLQNCVICHRLDIKEKNRITLAQRLVGH